MKLLWLCSSLFVLVSLNSCAGISVQEKKKSKFETESVTPNENKNTVPYTESLEKIEENTETPSVTRVKNKFTQTAQAIAGLGDISSEGYVSYANSISKSWEKLCEKSLMKIRPWAERHLDKYISHLHRVFYVFGGPDIAYPHEFFPYADEYILVGLEPLGTFDAVERIVNTNNFKVFHTAMNSYLRKGYFITSEMIPQLSKIRGSHGGIGIILLQLARLNDDIISVESLGIDSDGNIVADSKDALSLVKIVFNRYIAGETRTSTVYYIRMNLGNNNVNKLKMLTNFVKKKSFITFIKSASYALQDRNFTTLRDFILNNTSAILQDDTGIAFRHLKTWDIRLYGKYTGPALKQFSNYIQNDMKEYFSKNPSTPIFFSMGYGYNMNLLSLVLARKQ